jgi:hypothetical protein
MIADRAAGRLVKVRARNAKTAFPRKYALLSEDRIPLPV